MFETPDELPGDAHREVTRLCEDGDAALDEERYEEAVAAFGEAWRLLPAPAERWSAATFILAGLGDALFSADRFGEAADALAHTMRCPDGIGNPFLHLRLGQCRLELGDEGRAADELCRAFMAEGEEIFGDEDPKYLTFLKTRLDPPPGGWASGQEPGRPARPHDPAA